MKSSQREPQLTERQNWTRDNFEFLRDHILRHLTAKSEFRVPKGSASKASAAGSSSRQETVQIELFHDTSRSESTFDTSDISHLDTHMIVVKKFGDDKLDNPSDSYDEFQQETFNLLVSLKRTDKQKQR